MDDAFNLSRFLTAQERAYTGALEELKQGSKRGHWIWFIFPQLKGLGYSSNSSFYGITGLEEARAYLAHAVLGVRLRECTSAVLGVKGKTLDAIFGQVDAMKFRSSMTLFLRASEEDPLFRQALDTYCGGKLDSRTEELLNRPHL